MESVPQLREKDHLNPGVHAIMASLGEGKIKGLPEALTGHEIEYVNIDTDPSTGLEEGFSGEYIKPHWGYVMSPVDHAIKFSTRYVDCTGVVVVGTEKETGKNISFLTHQNPGYVTYDSDSFSKDLQSRLEEIKERCEPGTIDSILFGGKFSNVEDFQYQPNHPIHNIDKDEYLKSIKLAARIIESGLGFSPTVISGPKINPGQEQVIFDNDQRRLFLERLGRYDANFTKSFEAKDVDEFTSKLPSGQWPLSEEIRKGLNIKRKNDSENEQM